MGLMCNIWMRISSLCICVVLKSSTLLSLGSVKATSTMQISVINFIPFPKFPPLLSFSRNGRKLTPTIWARRPDVGENNSPTKPPFTLKIPKSFLAKSAVALFGLGFIDAGYSGDWSRIGVISKETEDLLKIAAYLIGPLCLLLIFSISEEERAT